jgi:hypothetical protein
LQERITLCQTPGQIAWRAYQQMHRKRWQRGKVNLRGLIQLVASRHHDENVHVAVGVRLAIGVRAEQDDFVRLKLFSDLSRESSNDAQGHMCPAIPSHRWRRLI